MEGRRFCFTLNNYTDEQFEKIIELCITKEWRYIIGKEIGKNGTKHLQGYINFGNPFRPIQNKIFKEICGTRIHWEKCKGNEKQNYDYCSKDGDFETNITELKKTGPKQKPETIKWYPEGCNEECYLRHRNKNLCEHARKYMMQTVSPLIEE